MPIATLSFELPEEDEDHNLAVNGWKYRATLVEFDMWLRGQVKHGNEQTTTFSDVRNRLWIHLKENDIDLLS